MMESEFPGGADWHEDEMTEETSDEISDEEMSDESHSSSSPEESPDEAEAEEELTDSRKEDLLYDEMMCSENSDFSELEDNDQQGPDNDKPQQETDCFDLSELKKELSEAEERSKTKQFGPPNTKLTPIEQRIMETMYGKNFEFQATRAPRLIQAVKKLDHPARFKITPNAATIGTTLRLKMIKQYPVQQDFTKPIFELADLSDQYEKMEQDMAEVYTDFPTDPDFDFSGIEKGDYAVVQDWAEGLEENEDVPEDLLADEPPILKRVKFVTIPTFHEEMKVYKVEYIDSYTKGVVDANSEVLMLDKEFAVLPPRVCAIEMEGISHYKLQGIERFFRYDADQYLFDGVLTAEVQPSGKVIVWSDRFPKEEYPYGINGVIIEAVLEHQADIPKLPPKGFIKEGGFVVHVTHEGYVCIQFNSHITDHYFEVFSEVDEKKIEGLRGSVQVARKREIYMAPHLISDGSYYRAVLHGYSEGSSSESLNSTFSSEEGGGDDVGVGVTPNENGEVRVRYLEYGDETLVKVADLVRAKDVHYLLNKFPSLYVKAHLENIWHLETQVYFPKYHGKDQQYTVRVVKDSVPKKKEPAEVILTWTDEDDKIWSLNKILEKAKDMAEPIVPYYNFSENFDTEVEVDGELRPENWTYKPLKYLGLEKGRRLRIGDELQVIFKYDEKMPSKYFFMIPLHRIEKLEELEDKLENINKMIEDDRLKQFTEQGPPFRWYVRLNGRVPGLSVLAKSKRLEGKMARGVLLKEHPQGKPEEREAQNGVKYVFRKRKWDVFLLDYGIVEKVDVVNMFESRSYCLELPSIGCLAYQKGVETKEKVEKWWRNLVGRRRSPEDRYDDNEWLEGTVRIEAIKKLKRYGEVPEVRLWVNSEEDEGFLESD